ncbi:MAG: hypothetical protein NC408_04430 [Candidatus Gastranaerophilales bacterium]|nr:hypothetical protein [Candidatus Gastranaerophilales bacterium]MCM1072282.1 hypothetical protein [Bacteroides sp.]
MEETEISTPVEEVIEDTSATVEPVETDTSTAEPEEAVETAEIEATEGGETPPEQTLYAGKYKSVEELEKGYSEAQKLINKSSEYEKKYNELLQQRETEAQKVQQEQLKQAQIRGFNSVEQAQIADAVQVAELEHFANNLNLIDPQNIEQVRAYLAEYYKTAHPAYLDEAKKYFPSSFLEKTAIEKSKYEAQLLNQYETQRAEEQDKASKELAEVLKTEYTEFLADINENEGKAQALKAFCDVGSINSKEDMQLFTQIYSQIAEYERAQALKELEAEKTIKETKEKAVIESTGSGVKAQGELKEAYSEAEVYKMSPAKFDELYSKYGEEFTKRIKG